MYLFAGPCPEPINRHMIKIYDNIIPQALCERIIEQFNEQSSWVSHEPGWMDYLGMYRQSRGQNEHSYNWVEECRELQTLVDLCYDNYRQDYDPYSMLPHRDFLVEGYRCKRYTQNEQEFKLHIDAGTSSNCSRYLGFLMYLNNSDAATEFPLQNQLVQAREGRMVIFPPHWQFPHRGMMPRSGDKYIVSTYFCWA